MNPSPKKGEGPPVNSPFNREAQSTTPHRPRRDERKRTAHDSDETESWPCTRPTVKGALRVGVFPFARGEAGQRHHQTALATRCGPHAAICTPIIATDRPEQNGRTRLLLVGCIYFSHVSRDRQNFNHTTLAPFMQLAGSAGTRNTSRSFPPIAVGSCPPEQLGPETVRAKLML